MAVIATTILLYLVALFLTVGTLRLFSYFLYTTQTISPQQTNLRDFLVLIGVVIPFVMLIYFGFAFLISDTISLGAPWPTAKKEELSFSESLVTAVTYVGLSGWLWLRSRKPTAPSTRILGPAIFATVIIFIIVSVIWNAHHDHIF
jgi:hypothetical protein